MVKPRRVGMLNADPDQLVDEQLASPSTLDPIAFIALRMLERAGGQPITSGMAEAADGVVTIVVVPGPIWLSTTIDLWRERARGGEPHLNAFSKRDWAVDQTFTSVMPRERPTKWDLEAALDVFSQAVSEGQHCCAVTPNIAWLPPEVVAVADHRFDVGHPTRSDVDAFMRERWSKSVRNPLTDSQASRIKPSMLRLATRPGIDGSGFLKRLLALVGDPGARESAAESVRMAPTLERMHGMGRAVQWGMAVRDDLAAYREGRLKWSDVDGGLLISGPPGCGKTTFARALASSCALPLVTGSYGEWLSTGTGHQGDLLRSMRRCFARAREQAPCIMFLDEIDSFRDREDARGNNADWNTQVLNALLAELDGVVAREGVVVLAACNDASKLDRALVRAGRLDKHVCIGLPSQDALTLILREHLAGDLANTDISAIAAAVVGASGADCEQLVRDARRLARVAKEPLALAHLAAVVFGPDLLPRKTLWKAAIHEGGHAVLSSLRGRLLSVNIRQNGYAGGTTIHATGHEFPTATDLRDDIAVCMGGRAAERIVLDEASPGSGGGEHSDLARATLQAVHAICAKGLDEVVGPVWHGMPDATEVPKRLARDPVLARQVKNMLDAAYQEALDQLQHHRSGLEAVASTLMERRVLSGDEVASIIAEKAPSSGSTT